MLLSGGINGGTDRAAQAGLIQMLEPVGGLSVTTTGANHAGHIACHNAPNLVCYRRPKSVQSEAFDSGKALYKGSATSI